MSEGMVFCRACGATIHGSAPFCPKCGAPQAAPAGAAVPSPWAGAGDGIPRSFGNSIAICLRKYVTFAGRAPRAEYWWFVLFCTLIQLPLAGIVGAATDVHTGVKVADIASLAFFLPSLACSVRRLHDRDKSGWWLLIAFIPLVGAIILLVWYCTRGTQGVNRFGPENPTTT